MNYKLDSQVGEAVLILQNNVANAPTYPEKRKSIKIFHQKLIEKNLQGLTVRDIDEIARTEGEFGLELQARELLTHKSAFKLYDSLNQFYDLYPLNMARIFEGVTGTERQASGFGYKRYSEALIDAAKAEDQATFRRLASAYLNCELKSPNVKKPMEERRKIAKENLEFMCDTPSAKKLLKTIILKK